MSVNTFSDSILRCQVSFMNDNYDLRAANSFYNDNVHILNNELDQFYDITVDYPIYDESWKKKYAITGEHCLQFNMYANIGNKTPFLLESAIINIDTIKNLLNKCHDEKLLTTSTNISVFMTSSPLYNDKPQSLSITFDFHRRNLFINRIICRLPADMCNQWFERCVRMWILNGAYKPIK